MSYIDKNLLSDEKVIYRTGKHIIIFVMPIVWIAVTLLFLISSNPLINQVAFVPGVVTLAVLANVLLTYVTSEFVITNKRMMMKEGFFYRHTAELRLTTVSQVSVVQSLLGRLLNYGTVFVNAFGTQTDSFTGIANPILFQKQAQEELNKLAR